MASNLTHLHQEDPTFDDLLDFEQRDEQEAGSADRVREALTGLPARPGTRR